MNHTTEQIETKIQGLLSQLTLEEKISMMHGDRPFWSGIEDMISAGIGAHSWDAGSISRLGIDGIKFVDGPRGIILEGATTFPVAIARGATWDVELEERVGEVIGRELRALGGNLFGGVCINLLRHPAWGRAQETFGEDPCHLSEMGTALVRGVQKHAMACVKHFALNSMENARFSVDVEIDDRALHEIYLPHFRRAVEEDVAAVMSSYNSMNGEWCGQNHRLLTAILKEKWGFTGYVLTDFIFGMRDAEKAALAGQDLEMPFYMHYNKNLKRLVKRGRVPEERLDDSVSRLLRRQIQFVKPDEYPADTVGCEAHRALSREAAQKSIVLLKNDYNLLPMSGRGKVAVIGRLADTPNTGDGGSSDTRPEYVVTPLQGIREAMADDTAIEYDDGTDLERAKKAARESDVAIIVVGYTHEDEGEYITMDTSKELGPLLPKPSLKDIPRALRLRKRQSGERSDPLSIGGDRDSLTLRPTDETLIQEICGANENTVVVLMGGSAIVMEAWRHQVPAILMLWYPGMEGGHALADILFGKVNPSGKLPFVIPANPDHLPFFDRMAKTITYDLWHGYRKLERDGDQPAFPFGYGCSYTSYRYSNLKLERAELDPTDILEISLEVSNTGSCAGDEVVQLYISAIDSSVPRAPKELKGFTKVSLDAGSTSTVKIAVSVSQLAYYDVSQERFVVEPLEYEACVGAHSLDPDGLKARFTVRGQG